MLINHPPTHQTQAKSDDDGYSGKFSRPGTFWRLQIALIKRAEIDALHALNAYLFNPDFHWGTDLGDILLAQQTREEVAFIATIINMWMEDHGPDNVRGRIELARAIYMRPVPYIHRSILEAAKKCGLVYSMNLAETDSDADDNESQGM